MAETTGPNSVLVDMSWVRNHAEAKDDSNVALFRDKQVPLPADAQRLFVRERVGLRPYLLALETIVLANTIVVDSTVVKPYLPGLSQNVRQLLHPIVPAAELYTTVATRVDVLWKDIRAQAEESPIGKLCKLSRSGGSDDPFWSHQEKHYHDELFRELGGDRSFADSQDTLPRALFYLELARATESSAFMSGEKSRWLELLNESMVPSVHEKITRVFDGALGSTLAEFGELFSAWNDAGIPPIANLIINRAISRRESLEAVALEIREEPTAVNYRQLTSELEGYLREGRSGLTKVAKVIRSLKRVADAWVQHLDVDYEVYYRSKTLKVDKLPGIGWLLELAGTPDVNVKDVLLKMPPPYLVFISSWYRSPDN